MRHLSGIGRLTGLLAALAVGLGGPGTGRAVADVASPDFPTAAVAVVHLGVVVASAWVLLVLVGGAARVRIPGVPAAWRAALFTTAVVVAVATPAQAETAPHDLDGLTLPDRPSAARIVSPAAAVAGPTSVTVRPGDTLWALAAERLPVGATDAEIAVSVAGWFEANRSVIGADPDLIVPGQILAPGQESS